MADFISREAAIAKILSEPPYARYPSEYAEKLKQIPAADVMPLEWVSVKDRLPEPHFPIWAACKADGRENWVIETGYIPESRSPWGNYYLLVNGKATLKPSWIGNCGEFLAAILFRLRRDTRM